MPALRNEDFAMVVVCLVVLYLLHRNTALARQVGYLNTQLANGKQDPRRVPGSASRYELEPMNSNSGVNSPPPSSQMSDDELIKYIEGNKVVVNFCANNWCGHSKNLKPTWVSLMETNNNVLMVDSDDHKAVCAHFQVRGYPTIKRFNYQQAGSVEEFNQPRTAEHLQNFVDGK